MTAGRAAISADVGIVVTNHRRKRLWPGRRSQRASPGVIGYAVNSLFSSVLWSFRSRFPLCPVTSGRRNSRRPSCDFSTLVFVVSVQVARPFD
jgi:hypothetical protein